MAPITASVARVALRCSLSNHSSKRVVAGPESIERSLVEVFAQAASAPTETDHIGQVAGMEGQWVNRYLVEGWLDNLDQPLQHGFVAREIFRIAGAEFLYLPPRWRPFPVP